MDRKINILSNLTYGYLKIFLILPDTWQTQERMIYRWWAAVNMIGQGYLHAWGY
ncbi:MAG: hypothetical protein FD151_316 [bacterium]|nr:MAG: hypothetical protein FD151_316 [bacterium]